MLTTSYPWITQVSQLLRLASPFFNGALEDVQGSAPIPVSRSVRVALLLCVPLSLLPADQHPLCIASPQTLPQVDGSLGAWTYILSCIYPLHDQPELTMGSVYALLPVVHKYDFTKLLPRLVTFYQNQTMDIAFGEFSSNPDHPNCYVFAWLALAERLQLDDLRELCLSRLRGMSRKQLEQATVTDTLDYFQKRGIRGAVNALGQELRDAVFVIVATAHDDAP